VQISLAQDTSWAETHLGGGSRITFGGGLQPPKPRPSYVPAVGRPMEAANFPHSMHFKLTLDALSDGHQNLGRCKFLKSKFRGGGVRFCACVISRPSAQRDSAIFCVGGS